MENKNTKRDIGSFTGAMIIWIITCILFLYLVWLAGKGIKAIASYLDKPEVQAKFSQFEIRIKTFLVHNKRWLIAGFTSLILIMWLVALFKLSSRVN